MTQTITEFVDAIITAASDRFSGRVETFGDYDEFEQGRINTPAILLDVEALTEGVDDGDDRIPVTCRISAFCMLSLTTPKVKLETRQFAAEFMSLVRRNKFGLGRDVDHPENIEARPGPFQSGNQGYDSFEVSWDQTIFLGESVWDASGVPVTEIFVGYAPDIGIGHEPDYARLEND